MISLQSDAIDGRALPHHVLPNSGWVTFLINEEADILANQPVLDPA
jgi:hypothetical protein